MSIGSNMNKQSSSSRSRRMAQQNKKRHYLGRRFLSLTNIPGKIRGGEFLLFRKYQGTEIAGVTGVFGADYRLLTIDKWVWFSSGLSLQYQAIANSSLSSICLSERYFIISEQCLYLVLVGFFYAKPSIVLVFNLGESSERGRAATLMSRREMTRDGRGVKRKLRCLMSLAFGSSFLACLYGEFGFQSSYRRQEDELN
jgi:hypothetical protein